MTATGLTIRVGKLQGRTKSSNCINYSCGTKSGRGETLCGRRQKYRFIAS